MGISLVCNIRDITHTGSLFTEESRLYYGWISSFHFPPSAGLPIFHSPQSFKCFKPWNWSMISPFFTSALHLRQPARLCVVDKPSLNKLDLNNKGGRNRYKGPYLFIENCEQRTGADVGDSRRIAPWFECTPELTSVKKKLCSEKRKTKLNVPHRRFLYFAHQHNFFFFFGKLRNRGNQVCF